MSGGGRSSCYECGANARAAAGGRTWYVEQEAAEEYDRPPRTLTADTSPRYFTIRLCADCTAREHRDNSPEVAIC